MELSDSTNENEGQVTTDQSEAWKLSEQTSLYRGLKKSFKTLLLLQQLVE